MFLAIFPKLYAIDDVLPQHVAAGAYRGHGVEVSIGHPDTESGIFLERGLTAIDLIAQMAPDGAPHEEEHEAEYQAHDGNHEEGAQGSIAMNDIADGDSRGNGELG